MTVRMFEHTADIGAHVEAPTLEELFAEAGRAVAQLLIENPDAIRLRERSIVELEAGDLESLFLDWMRELLYRFETSRLLFREFSIEVTADHRRLYAECRGETADWTRHEPAHEVKAVTYHKLRVARNDTGWEADVIFDI